MHDRIKDAFRQVQAEEALKEGTLAFLEKRTHDYRTRPKKRPVYACAAACVCLALILLGGRWLYFTPTAEISVDINPSIELSINRFDRVISVNGFNEDGRALSAALDIRFMDYAAAIERILSDSRIAELLSGDEIMTVTVTGPDGEQSARIYSHMEACMAGHGNAHCYFTSPEEVAPAHDAGLSHGKYRAFLEAQSLDPGLTPEDVQDMTMREIQDLIDCHSTGSGDDPPSHGGWAPGVHGYGHGGGHSHGKRGH